MSRREVGLRMGALMLAACVVAGPVRAAPVDLVIACPGLSPELRASLEARARADLSMKRLERWRLNVVCDGALAAVEFTPEGGLVSRREGALAGQPEDWVDRVLALVHEAAAVREPPTTTGAESPAGPEPPPPTLSPLAPPEPVRRPKKAAAPPSPAPVRAPPPHSAATLYVEPEASVGAEVWPSEPVVLVGPAAAVGFWFERRFRLVPTVAAAWSAGAGQDVSVRSLEGGLDAVVGSRWWFGLGARVAWLRFVPRPSLSPVNRTVVDPAIVARVGLSTSVVTGRLSVSVGARAYAQRRDVRIDGTVALRVPHIAAVAAVGYSAEPF